MAVMGIWKQDIKASSSDDNFWQIHKMIWQVDINNWQINIQIWQGDIINWQVTSEIYHHKVKLMTVFFYSKYGYSLCGVSFWRMNLQAHMWLWKVLLFWNSQLMCPSNVGYVYILWQTIQNACSFLQDLVIP